MSSLASARSVFADCATVLKPKERLTVHAAAEKYVFLDVPNGYSGPFRYSNVDYLKEPSECLSDRNLDSVVFVGPAQTGKTEGLIINWICHNFMCDPSDIMIIQSSQEEARDFSSRKVDRTIEATPRMKAALRKDNHSDNVFDKKFISGTILNIGWPSKSKLAGKAVSKMGITDLDRGVADVGGDGDLFILARNRTKSFASRGMTLAESSPSRPVLDLEWRPSSPHEAPPTDGILGLFNTGDRRKMYGKCPHCLEFFCCEAAIADSAYIPEHGSLVERVKGSALICKKCGAEISLDHEKSFKREYRWVGDGQEVDKDGILHGDKIFTGTASFWMPGWFAAFQSWEGLVTAHIKALDTFERTGDEKQLKTTVNTDQGAPYIEMARRNRDESIASFVNRQEPLERYIVPEEARVLMASVDVQKGSFIVEVAAYGPHWEQWIIDRYAIPKVRPDLVLADWDNVTHKVVNATYRLESGKEVRVHRVMCDMHGQPGVTDNAYKWWRSLKTLGLSFRVLLVRGGNSRTAPIIEKTYPDTKKKGGAGVGDVPVWQINTDRVKDMVSADTEKENGMLGLLHLPTWLSEDWIRELVAEEKTTKGWVKKKGVSRNEAFDLAVYRRAGLWAIGFHLIDWSAPPPWAMPWDFNSESMTKDERVALQSTHKPKPKRRIRRVR